MKFGTGERTCGTLPLAKFHVYRGNVSPLRGEKPIAGNNLSSFYPIIDICTGVNFIWTYQFYDSVPISHSPVLRLVM